jgi:hypothetical protein
MNNIFNNGDLYPTPQETIYKMLQYFDVNDKVILEPSAGKGDIINVLMQEGAKEVLYCEKSEAMQKILNGTGRFMCADFLDLKAEQISHINAIIMNPPFSDGVKHVLHAYEIAPKGATIISLINSSNLKNEYSNDRKQLNALILENGSTLNLGKCFDNAERSTNVEVTLIVIKKAGENYTQEFEGFFMDEEPEVKGVNGLMQYDAIRDLVNRYVAAVKLYDEQLNTGVKMKALLSGFYGGELSFSCSDDGKLKLRNDFKKDMQKAGWKFIFDKLNLYKDVTSATRADINKFIEEKTNIPFTVKNIWQMLAIIAGTREQTMDRALVAAFDRITDQHEDNRHHVKGWKTNLHYLVGKKFILPNQVSPSKEYGYENKCYRSLKNSHDGIIADLEKALCYITGDIYSDITGEDKWTVIAKGINTVHKSINNNLYSDWYESHYFKYKAYKNGNMHFEWLDLELWGKFNQRISKLKGYPLYEQKEQTAYQKRNAGYKTESKQKQEAKQEEAEILFSIEL